jgi:PAS domain S-box-containing protein
MSISPTDSSFLAAVSPSGVRLQEARDRLYSVVDHMVDGVITFDDKGLVETVNTAAETLFGYAAEELAGQNVRRLFADPFRSQVEEAFARDPAVEPAVMALSGREAAGCRKDGTVFAADLSVSGFRFGGRQYFTAIIRDISERRKLEAEQQEINERLRAVADNVADGIITFDEEGSIASFNRAAEGIFGYTVEEIVGQNIRRIISERSGCEDRSPGAELAGKAGGQAGVGREAVGRRKDGTLFPLDVAVTEFRLQGKRLFSQIVRDITERKQAQKRIQFLANARSLLTSVVDSSKLLSRIAQVPVPLFADWCVVDVCDGKKVLTSAVAHCDPEGKTMLRRLRARQSNIAGSSALLGRILQRGGPQLVANVSNPFEFAEPQTGDDRELLLRLDPQSMICVPLKGHDRIHGVITFALTGGSLRYSQADLEIAEEFAHRASIALQNARLYEEAREADRRKDEFLAMLAHELRNPLAPIRNALEVVRAPDVDAGTAQSAFAVLERQVDHMVRLVDDLLDLSRLMRGKIQLRPECLSLNEVVERAIETARPVIEEQGHKLIVSPAKAPLWVFADPVRLDQVIANLLNNAAKYTEPGGVIRLLVKQREQQAVIKIRDTGIGIDPKLLPHLFDLFRQAESALERSQGGLGIGLTLVRSLVELHGGKVEAHSDGPGTGSEFVVRLPLVSAQVMRAAPEGTAAKRVPGGEFNILVVDDNVDAAEMLSLVLRRDGHQITLAHDGLAALAAVERDRPDVVLLDIGLPKLNGYDVARRLRSSGAYRPPIVIAMTGFGQERDRRHALDSGCDAHLIKPVAPQTLRVCLRDLGEKLIAKKAARPHSS